VPQDNFGNKITVPGDDFQVKIVEVVEGIRVRARVVDNGDGTYDVTWTGTIRGEYNLHVTLKEEPIKGSPWRVLVNTGNPSAPKCTMSGTGLGGSPAGSVASLLIESNDHYGNVVTQGGAPFEGSLISVDGKHAGQCELVDHEDGTYTLSYEAHIMGEYFLAVRLHGEHVHESPFVVFIDHGDTDPSRCKADGKHGKGNSLVSCTCGHPAGFKLVAYDRFGNRCTVGGDEFSGMLKGHADVPVEIVDHNDGSYTCEYTCLWSGAYNLHIHLGREEIRGSPFAITAYVDVIHPPSCSVNGGGIYAALAGVQAEFHVHAKDRFENTRTNEDAIEVKIEGPEQVAISRRYLGEGQYDFAWNASAAGNYLVSITCAGEDLATSPYNVSVGPGIVSPINCVAQGEGVSQGIAGVENSFQIQSRDKFGNNRTLGGDKYHVSITGPSASETKIRDSEDGTYKVQWTALTKGSYWISVILLGEEISGSPFLAEISSNGVDVKKSTAEGMGLLAIAMFRKSVFTIYSRDRYVILTHFLLLENKNLTFEMLQQIWKQIG
jgi:filamin